jgi:hypothetical protein
MKMTRDALKELIKECIVEVLRDGLGARAATGVPTTEARRPAQNGPKPKHQSRANQPSDIVLEAVRREAGGSSVMTDILTDTAMTTLPQFIASDRGQMVQGGGPAELAVASSTPEELFGEENTSRWASLAFDLGKN